MQYDKDKHLPTEFHNITARDIYINLDQYMFDLQQLLIGFNGIMAEANSLMDMANNPMGMINDLANSTIGDVTKKELSSKFISSKTKIPNIGISRSSFWVKLNIKNKNHNQIKYKPPRIKAFLILRGKHLI